MAEPGTLKGRHYAQIFLILLLFMFAVFTRHSIWIYYVRYVCVCVCVSRRVSLAHVVESGALE